MKIWFILFSRRATIIKANGTAVEGVCVSGEAGRPLVPVVWQGTVPAASRYGAIFAIKLRAGFITIAVQVGSC